MAHPSKLILWLRHFFYTMRVNTKLLQRSLQYLHGITKQDKIAVLHHTDPDGICSGVLVAKAVERLRGRKIDLRVNQKGTEHAILDATISRLKKKKINKLITTDLMVDKNKTQLHKLATFADVLVLDHHPYFGSKHPRIIVAKPQVLYGDKKPNSYPASKFCYDILKRVVEMVDLDWMAAIGVITDGAFKRWKVFLKTVLKKHHLKYDPDPFKTAIGNAGRILHAAELYSERNVPKGYAVVYQATSVQDIIKSPLVKYRRAVRKELDYWLKHTKKYAEVNEACNLIYYELSQKYNVKGPVATILSLQHPHMTVVTLSTTSKYAYISGRRQDGKIDMNKLFQSALKGLPEAAGGGHPPAAGGRLLKKDLQRFKSNLVRILCKK